MRQTLARALILGIAWAACAGPLPAADAPAKAESTLYTRLGGYDAIAAVTGDLLPRLMGDPVLGRFWAHRGADGLAREKQLVINFIAAKAGGPLHYSGREMKQSHIGMQITQNDWDRFMKHLGATLDKFSVPARERKEVVDFMEETRDGIMD